MIKGEEESVNINYRWIILSILCLVSYGSYIGWDWPSILSSHLIKDLSINHTQYNLIYSVSTLPITILPLFGGYFIDQIEINTSLIIYTFLRFFSHILCTLSLYYNNFQTLLISRFMFGITNELIIICQSIIIVFWYYEKELAFSFGIVASLGRVGTLLNTYILPQLYVYKKQLWLPILFVTGIMGFGFLLSFIITFYNKKKFANQQQSFVFNSQNSEIQFSNILKFKSIFWLLITSSALCFTVNLTLMYNIQGLLINQYGFYQELANQFYAIPFTISIICIPCFGLCIDIYGNRGIMLIISGVLSLICLIFFTLYSGCNQCNGIVFILLCFLGISLSLISSVTWPSIPLLIKRKQGLAFGLASCIMNIGQTLIPIIYGQILDYWNNYNYVLYFLIIISLISLILMIILEIVDRKIYKILMNPQKYEYKNEL